MSERTDAAKPGPLDAEFELGYHPCDEPPGFEEREYAKWKAAGGVVQPTVAEHLQAMLGREQASSTSRQNVARTFARRQLATKIFVGIVAAEWHFGCTADTKRAAIYSLDAAGVLLDAIEEAEGDD